MAAHRRDKRGAKKAPGSGFGLIDAADYGHAGETPAGATGEWGGITGGDGSRRRHSAGETLSVASSPDRKDSKGDSPPLRTQARSLALLLVLYTLQGVPIGLASSIPLLMQQRRGGADDATVYAWQATFALASWPYSMKLLWAPVVDSVYSERIGRRKSWVVPVQLAAGLLLLLLSDHVAGFLGEKEGVPPQPGKLAIIFFSLYLLVATQDIAVDAWALTMLHRAHVGWASTCNTMGLRIGHMIAYVMFLALNSPDFGDKLFLYTGIRIGESGEPLLSLSAFMVWWGGAILATTALVAFFKSEEREPRGSDGPSASEDEEAGLLRQSESGRRRTARRPNGVVATVLSAYSDMAAVLRLPAVRTLIFLLLTYKFTFQATYSATSLELNEVGVRQDVLALMSAMYVPVEILTPVIVSRWTAGSRPLDVVVGAFPYRVAAGLVTAGLTAMAPEKDEDNGMPMWFLVAVVVLGIVRRILSNAMFVAVLAFYARIADPTIGGTYMTMLATAGNLGAMWARTVVLRAIGLISKDGCYVPDPSSNGSLVLDALSSCNRFSKDPNQCAASGADAVCDSVVDGYEAMVVVCAAVGTVWYFVYSKKMLALQDLPMSAWRPRRT